MSAEGCIEVQEPMRSVQEPHQHHSHQRNTSEPLQEYWPQQTDGTQSNGGGIFKRAAIAVLREAGKSLSTGDIFRKAQNSGYLSGIQGKTPHATMAGALYRHVPHQARLRALRVLDSAKILNDVPVRQPVGHDEFLTALFRCEVVHCR